MKYFGTLIIGFMLVGCGNELAVEDEHKDNDLLVHLNGKYFGSENDTGAGSAETGVLPAADFYRPEPIQINARLDIPGTGALLVLPDADGGFLLRWSPSTEPPANVADECYQIAQVIAGEPVGLVRPYAEPESEARASLPLSTPCSPENGIDRNTAVVRADAAGLPFAQGESVAFVVIQRRGPDAQFLNATNLTMANARFNEVDVFAASPSVDTASARRNANHFYNTLASLHYNKPAETLSLVTLIKTDTFDQVFQHVQIDFDLENQRAVYMAPGLHLRLHSGSSENANQALLQYASLVLRMLKLEGDNPVRAMLETCRAANSYDCLRPLEGLIVPGERTDTYTREFVLLGTTQSPDAALADGRFATLLAAGNLPAAGTGVVLELRDAIHPEAARYGLQFYVGIDGETGAMPPGRNTFAIYFHDEESALTLDAGTGGTLTAAPIAFVFSAFVSFVANVVVPQIVNAVVSHVQQKLIEEITKRIPILNEINRALNQIRQTIDFIEKIRRFDIDLLVKGALPKVEVPHIDFAAPRINLSFDMNFGEATREQNVRNDLLKPPGPGGVSLIDQERFEYRDLRKEKVLVGRLGDLGLGSIFPRGLIKKEKFYERLCYLKGVWEEKDFFNEDLFARDRRSMYCKPDGKGGFRKRKRATFGVARSVRESLFRDPNRASSMKAIINTMVYGKADKSFAPENYYNLEAMISRSSCEKDGEGYLIDHFDSLEFERKEGPFARRELFYPVIDIKDGDDKCKQKDLSNLISYGRMIAEPHPEIAGIVDRIGNAVKGIASMEVYSYFRDPHHNLIYNGAWSSAHQTGKAVDVVFMNVTRTSHKKNSVCHNRDTLEKVYNASLLEYQRSMARDATLGIRLYEEGDHLHVRVCDNSDSPYCKSGEVRIQYKYSDCPEIKKLVKEFCSASSKSCQPDGNGFKILNRSPFFHNLRSNKPAIRAGRISEAQAARDGVPVETAPPPAVDESRPETLVFQSAVPGEVTELYRSIRGDDAFARGNFQEEIEFTTPEEFQDTTVYLNWFPNHCTYSFEDYYRCPGASQSDCHSMYHNVRCSVQVSVNDGEFESYSSPSLKLPRKTKVRFRLERTYDNKTRDSWVHALRKYDRAYTIPVISYGQYVPERIGYEYHYNVKPAATTDDFLKQFMKFEAGGRDYWFVGRIPKPYYYQDPVKTPIFYVPGESSVYQVEYTIDPDPSGADFMMVIAGRKEEVGGE